MQYALSCLSATPVPTNQGSSATAGLRRVVGTSPVTPRSRRRHVLPLECQHGRLAQASMLTGDAFGMARPPSTQAWDGAMVQPEPENQQLTGAHDEEQQQQQQQAKEDPGGAASEQANPPTLDSDPPHWLSRQNAREPATAARHHPLFSRSWRLLEIEWDKWHLCAALSRQHRLPALPRCLVQGLPLPAWPTLNIPLPRVVMKQGWPVLAPAEPMKTAQGDQQQHEAQGSHLGPSSTSVGTQGHHNSPTAQLLGNLKQASRSWGWAMLAVGTAVLALACAFLALTAACAAAVMVVGVLASKAAPAIKLLAHLLPGAQKLAATLLGLVGVAGRVVMEVWHILAAAPRGPNSGPPVGAA